ncbi:MAG TPA: PhoU domain-containing protein, partial [Thermoanaerobaculia bacterium]
MQRHFDRDIEELKDLFLRMGAMVEDAIMQSIRALQERDTSLAEEVIRNDDRIDQMELEIDRRTLELIAKMQPT